MKNFKKILFLATAFIAVKHLAQQTTSLYPVAKASKKHYNALYVINESDENKIKAIIRNVGNALEDPRLKGKLEVELLAFGGGVEMFKKNNSYELALAALKDKGVVMVMCENTLKEKKIAKSELFDFVNYTPSANGEIILREYEGWAVVKP